jgi:hypothetical protein
MRMLKNFLPAFIGLSFVPLLVLPAKAEQSAGVFTFEGSTTDLLQRQQPSQQNNFLSTFANGLESFSQCANGNGNTLRMIACTGGGILRQFVPRSSVADQGILNIGAANEQNFANQGLTGNVLSTGGTLISQVAATQVGPALQSQRAMMMAQGTDISQQILRNMSQINHSGNQIGAMQLALQQNQLPQMNRTLGSILNAQSATNQGLARLAEGLRNDSLASYGAPTGLVNLGGNRNGSSK